MLRRDYMTAKAYKAKVQKRPLNIGICSCSVIRLVSDWFFVRQSLLVIVKCLE